ncbi:SU10 major capsid protein, partial [Fundidesulfovibrio putealis]
MQGATARTAPSRLSNYCQILEDSFKISGTLDAVTP